MQVGYSGITTAKCAHNIGVMFDHHMDMTSQLVCSLVMPCLDYGNISLYCISEGLLIKLQKAQNDAARLVVKCLRRDHNITPHLRDLHWLPVRSRIKYKILVTTYRALHNESPAYINELLTPHTPPMNKDLSIRLL